MYGSPYGYGAPGNIMLGPDMGQSIPSVPLEQPKQLFRYGEQSIWSSLMFTGGGAALANTQARAFATPVGQVGQGFTNALSINETNLKEGGRVPSGVAYDVFGIAAQYLLATAANDTGTLSQPMDTNAEIQDVLNFVYNGVLTWDFTQTQVDVAPMVLTGAGGGAFGALSVSTTVAAATTSGGMSNGTGSIWLYRRHPVALPGNTTFALLLRLGNRCATLAGNNLVVRLVLLGYYKNVIEIG